MPTKIKIDQKQADIKEAISYEFNEQDVERIVNIFFKCFNNYIYHIFLSTHFLIDSRKTTLQSQSSQLCNEKDTVNERPRFSIK